MRIRRCLSVLLIVFVPSLAWGTKSKVWQQQEARHYERATLQRTVLSAEGTVRLSRRLESYASLDASHVWAVATDGLGFTYAATGSTGKLFKIGPNGEVSLAYQSKDSQLLSLAVTRQGMVYVGTGPSGSIVQLTPEGEASVLVQTPESYVWTLVWDEARQELFAGTGPQGRVYRIRPTGEMALHYTTRQEHVLCLALGRNGQLYAGTGQKGVVYQITPAGHGSVLLETPQPEVKTLLVRGDAIYVGTSSPHRRGTAARANAGGKNMIGQAEYAPSEAQTTDSKLSTSESDSQRVNTAPKPIPAPSLGSSSLAMPGMAPPSSRENSVYRLSPQGSVREIFRIKAMVTCLAEKDGNLIIGTGATGQIFELNETERDFTEIARVDDAHILALCPQEEGWLVATGDPGKLFVLRRDYSPSGTLVSEVFDAKAVSKWGSVRWKSEVPEATSLSVDVRSGNVVDPDETWSAWSSADNDPARAVTQVPTGRFFQYRVSFQTRDPRVTPVLRSMEVRYQQVNQAPVLGGIDVGQDTLADKPRKTRIRWTAADPNEDELTFSVAVRKEGWPQWVEIATDLEKTEYDWDTTTVPSGNYQVRITASDRKENAEVEALTDMRTSARFTVDQLAPVVTIRAVKLQGDRALVEADARDEHSLLSSAMVSVDGQKWINVYPVGGLYDGQAKKFAFDTPSLKPGTHVVVLRVTDAAGNIGAVDNVFEVRVKPNSSAYLRNAK